MRSNWFRYIWSPSCILYNETPLLKPNKYNDISVTSIKNYTKEKFLDLLEKIDSPYYMTFTCLNKAYQEFMFKLSEVIDLLCPSKKLRSKANSEPWINWQRSFPIGKNGSSESYI